MRFLTRVSDTVARIERVALMALIAMILGLMVLNVTTRAMNVSLYWVDELAINLMIVSAFVGTSVIFRRRGNFAVTIISDLLPDTARRWLSTCVQLINLGFALFLVAVTWLWFDPVTLAANRFDIELYFAGTFNSVYTEMTSTIGVRRFWFFLVMPWFALSLSIHCLACLAEDLSDFHAGGTSRLRAEPGAEP
ncbi:TRAP transporter small permease [Hoeflea sp.]|uniref:TRAP transporter small permease n=1 Tax=Hoeflea sp. TaxID=1940281 RepID=UPI003B0124B2